MTTTNRAPERTAPHDLDAERAVLGACLLDPIVIPTLRPILDQNDFYERPHQIIWRAIIRLTERRVAPDIITIPSFLMAAGTTKGRDWMAEIGGVQYLSGLMGAVPTAVYAQNYADIVRDHARRRRIIDAGASVMIAGYDDDRSLPDVVEGIRATIDAVASESTGPTYINMPAAMERSDRRLQTNDDPPLQTGFRAIDDAIGGLRRGQLIVPAGRPGMGKSALGTGIAYNVASRSGLPVGIISLEMDADEIADRLLGYEAGISMFGVRKRLESELVGERTWEEISRAQGELSNLPIYIDDDHDRTLSGVVARARVMHSRERLALLIVDYLQLMTDGGRGSDNRVQEVSRISSAMKMIARELRIPVIAISQLSRAVESRDDRRPRLSDLRDSGSIEQDADIVMFLYRDAYYNPPAANDIGFQAKLRLAELKIAKNRGGPSGDNLLLDWSGPLMKFRDMPDLIQQRRDARQEEESR